MTDVGVRGLTYCPAVLHGAIPKEEALQAIQDAAEASIEDMIEAGETLPSQSVLLVEAPVVTVTHDV
jgi:predicted RNase H-like HicB family nuclease